jgi:chemotaxis signal transduction protein
MPSVVSEPTPLAGRYTLIALGAHRYGIPAHRICLVATADHALRAAHLPPAVRHVLYCGSRLVPIVDLRAKFQLDDNSGPDTRIVVVRAQLSGLPSMPLGMWVDRVGETMHLAAAELRLACQDLPLPTLARTAGPLHALLDLDAAINPWEAPHTAEHAAVA